MFEGRYETLANGYLTTPERGKYWTDFYYGDILKQYGKPKEIKVIETVARKNNIFLSFVVIEFDKIKYYTTVAWRGDEIVQFKVDREINKVFSPKSQDEYYSSSTGMTLNFKEENNEPALYIQKSDKTEIIAKKK